MQTNNLSILLAEDDENLGFVIKDNLEEAGYTVELYPNGIDALKAFNKNDFDICILDIMMPGKDGFDLAKDIRKKDSNIPIVFLTARSMKEDKIRGFRIGADDYITKPFSMEELVLRVQVIARRTAKQAPSGSNENMFRLGIYVFNYKNLELEHDGETKQLTQKEADILYQLCLRKNEVLSREDAVQAVWGNYDYFAGRSMDVFITKLRKYLKKDPSIQIRNIHGVGFKLTIEETKA